MSVVLNLSKKLKASDGEFSLNPVIELKRGEIGVIFGSSGAGKTTTLRMIAGLTDPDDGLIMINDEVWFNKKQGVNRFPVDRHLGFVFQDYALFPNMTVRENITFALSGNEGEQFVDELLEMIELATYSNRKPTSLSGGQQQRLALARALARRPPLLLMDEPLAALDLKTRRYLQDELLKLHELFNFTTLMVTHDLHEILRVADRVFCMEQGRIIATGSPFEVFHARSELADALLVGKVCEVKQNLSEFAVEIKVGANRIMLSVPASTAEDLKAEEDIYFYFNQNTPVYLGRKAEY